MTAQSNLLQQVKAELEKKEQAGKGEFQNQIEEIKRQHAEEMQNADVRYEQMRLANAQKMKQKRLFYIVLLLQVQLLASQL